MSIRNVTLGLAAVLALCVGLAASAPSAHAGACGGGWSYNGLGEPANFTNVRPMQGMNCASARYVVNKWLRRAYERQYSSRIPTRFWDGYVTWNCFKRSGVQWQCNEYDSGTAFRFTAYRS
jgi:hypothetical protein